MTGPVYWHPLAYRFFMKLLYGAEFEARYLNVLSHIEPGWTVLDVCCGDCYLYHFLRDRNAYTGVDVNPRFVAWAEKSGIQTICFDVRQQDWPEVDCVVMLGSLYHFIPDQKVILKKGLKTAKKRFIVSEPIDNLAQRSAWLSRLSSVMINPGKSWSNERFTQETLTLAFQDSGCTRILENGRELVGIFDLELNSQAIKTT